jgi:hypothetical protein
MWKIDRDYISEKNEVSRVGAEGAEQYTVDEGEKIRFRLLDDDGEVYYGGWLLDDKECINQESALSYGTYDAGCTTIEVKRNGEWVQEIG